MKQVRAAFESALRNARDAGHLIEGLHLGQAAEFLLGMAMGVRAYSRLYGAIEAAQGQVEMVLQMIESWRPADA